MKSSRIRSKGSNRLQSFWCWHFFTVSTPAGWQRRPLHFEDLVGWLRFRQFSKLIHTDLKMHLDLIFSFKQELPDLRICMHGIYTTSMCYKLFCQSRESCAFMLCDERGQFFFTRVCELYMFIEGMTFSVYFLDASNRWNIWWNIFVCLVTPLIGIEQCNSMTSSLPEFLWHFPSWAGSCTESLLIPGRSQYRVI